MVTEDAAGDRDGFNDPNCAPPKDEEVVTVPPKACVGFEDNTFAAGTGVFGLDSEKLPFP